MNNMNNIIPKSRIELQKLKIKVLEKYIQITLCTFILALCSLFVSFLPCANVLLLCAIIYLSYKTYDTMKILHTKEIEQLYKMMEQRNE